MHAADRALYVAKEQGRDRTVVYSVNTAPRYSGVPVNIERVDPQVRDRKRRSGDHEQPPAPRA